MASNVKEGINFQDEDISDCRGIRMEYIFNACIDSASPSYRPMMQQVGNAASVAFGKALKDIKSILEHEIKPVKAEYTFERNSEAIPFLIYKIYENNKLEDVKDVLDLNFTGDRLLTYLAILHDARCLKRNGSIDLKYTKEIVYSILKYMKKREFGNLNFAEEAEQRIQVFLKRMEEGNRQQLCAIENVKLEWLTRYKCRLIFGDIEAFNYEVGELAGQILFNFKLQGLPRRKE